MFRIVLVKNILTIMCLFGFISCFAAESSDTEHQAYIFIQNIYQHPHPDKAVAQKISFFSALFLGKPYVLHALGEGSSGDYDRSPLYRIDAFDCETYVDTVLALALSSNVTQFEQRINAIRYANSDVHFIKRNHFTCIDWNKNNQKQGALRDITPSIHDKRQHPIFKLAKAIVNKPAWYQHLTLNTVHIKNLSKEEQEKKLTALKKEGQQLSIQHSVVPYLPLDVLFDAQGHPNIYLFKQIPHASIIEIVRPNWDLRKEIGTAMNISHLGFAIWKHKILYFREASSEYQQVVDVPLIEYLRKARKSPTIKGINVQIVPR